MSDLLNFPVLEKLAQNWGDAFPPIIQVRFCYCIGYEPAYALVVKVDEALWHAFFKWKASGEPWDDPPDELVEMKNFFEWQTAGESCGHIQEELAAAYRTPPNEDELPGGWIWFPQPVGAGLPELVVPGYEIVLYDRDATASQPASEELSADPPQGFAVESITHYDPAKRKGFRFKISLRGQEDKFFRKGWQVLNILSRYCGEKVPYDEVYRLYTETAAPPDDSSHKSKTKGDKLTFQKLAPSTSGEEEDNTNVGFSTAERSLEMTDKKTIDDVSERIKKLKQEELALTEEGLSKSSAMVSNLREEREELEDYLKRGAYLRLNAEGKEVPRPKHEKSKLAKKKETIKKAIKGVREEAGDAWPELRQYLEDHLEVAKDFLRFN